MTLTDSITFWAGQFIWKLVVTVVIIALVCIVAYFTQDKKE